MVICTGVDTFKIPAGITAYELARRVKCPCREFKSFKRSIDVREDTYNELMRLVTERKGQTVDDIIMEQIEKMRTGV